MSSSNGVDGAPRFLAASPSEVTATSGLVEPTGSQYGTSSTVSKIASATSATPNGELSPIEYFTQVEKNLVLMDLMDLMDHMAFMDAGAAHELLSF